MVPLEGKGDVKIVAIKGLTIKRQKLTRVRRRRAEPAPDAKPESAESAPAELTEPAEPDDEAGDDPDAGEDPEAN